MGSCELTEGMQTLNVNSIGPRSPKPADLKILLKILNIRKNVIELYHRNFVTFSLFEVISCVCHYCDIYIHQEIFQEIFC